MKNNTLYHYCSLETLIEILKSRTLQLSEITKSNDREEIKLLLDKYISYVNTYAENTFAHITASYITKNQIENTIFLVICFSEKENSPYMWNSYAKGGVCIGFNTAKLMDWAKHIQVFQNKVIYNSNDNCPSALLGKVKYFDLNSIDTFIKEECKNDQLVTASFPNIFEKAPFAKSSFWENEAEWRISIPLIFNEYQNKNLSFPSEVKMDVQPNSSYPLRTSCFIHFCPDMINSITLAPDCKATIEEINRALLVFGYDHLVQAHSVKNSKEFFEKKE